MESNVVYKNVGFRTKHTLTLLGGFGADEKEAENKERCEKTS